MMALAGPSRLNAARPARPSPLRQSTVFKLLVEGNQNDDDDDDDDLGIAGLFVTDAQEDSNARRPLFDDGSDSDVEQRDDGGEPGRPDTLVLLNNTLERRAELAAIPEAPPAGNARNTLGRRLTSTFSNLWSKSKSQFFTRTIHECIACTEPIADTDIRVPCGHHYDTGCIISLFEAASKDESLFPPRCCRRPIPFRSVRTHFPASVRITFLEKSQEFSTPRRVYCARPQCSRFLGAQTTSKGSRPPKSYSCICRTTTCSQCKHAHEGGKRHSCADFVDEGTEVVLALGKAEGWARCPGCRAMIELNLGCYHMTCLCKVEFCYLCEAPWKTCQCAQWDETRLEAVAQERMQHIEQFEAPRPAPVLRRWAYRDGRPREPAAAPVPVVMDRQQMLQAVVEDLRVNHDCRHAEWRYRDGGGRCAGCLDHLDRYVFDCRGCHTIACNRCRYNRF